MGNPLSELGLSVDDGVISVDQKLVLSMTKPMEEAIRKFICTLSQNSKDATRIMRVISYAAASYLVLAGVAKVIEASKKGNSSSNTNEEK